MEILLGIGGIVLVGVLGYFVMQKEENIDVVKDYKLLKKAYKKFRNENIGLTKGIDALVKYLPEDHNIKLDYYRISSDDKFLVLEKVPRKLDAQAIVNEIGGRSSFTKDKIKMSFVTRGNGIEPKAVIKVMPMSNVSTTTKLEYSADGSTAEGNEILKYEWVNNKEYFDKEGLHTIKLRIMDRHFNWSAWTSVEVFVTEEKGVAGIDAGSGHLMMRMNNGKVYGYGENSSGQLGNCSSSKNLKLDEIVQIDKVKSIAIGHKHTVFLKADRRVYATGKNDNGQLGTGNRTQSKVPVLTWGLENIVSVACGTNNSAAVTHDGTVYSWGLNDHQALGHSDSNYVDRPTRIEGLANVKAMTLGTDYTLALGFDGNVTAWGSNNHGQLGLGYKSKYNEPTTTIFKDVRMIATGKDYTLAVTNKGRVMGVGLNRNHQLGFDGGTEILFPTEVPNLKEIVKVTCSDSFSLALDGMGNVYTWGQYSGLDIDYAHKPLKSDKLKYIKDIAVTKNHGYALTEQGEVFEFSSKFKKMRKLEVYTNES